MPEHTNMETSNLLSQETSPYLLQHAGNPVHWHPWSESALSKARESNRPILLSIGYSACHWCHVMAHESFEDEECAQVMNQHYVNIKVDREERPDLDKTYQLAHQLLTQQSGGWPLTVFLDPHTLLPFFTGTYFPKKPRFQLPGFEDLILRVATAYQTQTEEWKEQGEKLSSLLDRINQFGELESSASDSELISQALKALESQYDANEGGFGGAPKFPMPARVQFLMQQFAYANQKGEKPRGLLDKVMRTLTKMARGGIYDHLAGGFYRYSTDATWTVPHFEKMLYDNGGLLAIYSDALKFGPDQLFIDALSDTADWMQREMQTPEGGYISAMDADSEGEEGKYYLWLRHKVKALLDAAEYALIETLYGLDKPANFERQWILRRTDAWRSVVNRLSLDSNEAVNRLKSAKTKLLIERNKRIPPAKDIKILAAWNGLAIKGMLRASQQLNKSTWRASAFAALDFAQQQLWSEEDQRLYATWTQGNRAHPAYLDDYANLIDATLTALSTEWRDEDVDFVHRLADRAIELFFDQNAGGFFFTSHDHEKLIYRPKPTVDDAFSPGNATIVQSLIVLGNLFANERYLDVAEQTLTWAKPALEQAPAAHVSFIAALQAWLEPPELILIRGPVLEGFEWLDLSRQHYLPGRHAFFIPYQGSNNIPDYLPKLVSLDQQKTTRAYICQGLSCSLPIDSLDEFRHKLGSS